MTNPYKFHSKNCSKDLVSISADEASKIINRHNVFFTHYTDEYDLVYQDLFVYQLDPAKTFDEQHSQIRYMNNQCRTIIFYYTDYKTNNYFEDRKIQKAINILKNQNIKITASSIKKNTQLGLLKIKSYLEKLEQKIQPSLFDFKGGYI